MSSGGSLLGGQHLYFRWTSWGEWLKTKTSTWTRETQGLATGGHGHMDGWGGKSDLQASKNRQTTVEVKEIYRTTLGPWFWICLCCFIWFWQCLYKSLMFWGWVWGGSKWFQRALDSLLDWLLCLFTVDVLSYFKLPNKFDAINPI